MADSVASEPCDDDEFTATFGVVDAADICLYTFLLVRWDPAKAKANLAAHGVDFAEAATVLDDDHAITREDADSVGEQRFVTLGLSGIGNLLVVVYSWRGPMAIRLISAWKANARQRKQYAQSAG